MRSCGKALEHRQQDFKVLGDAALIGLLKKRVLGEEHLLSRWSSSPSRRADLMLQVDQIFGSHTRHEYGRAIYRTYLSKEAQFYGMSKPAVKNAGRRRTQLLILVAMAGLLGVAFLLFRRLSVVPPGVSFSQSTRSLEAFDFVEITAQVSAPRPRNPFTDGYILGTFKTAAGDKQWKVEGFCDSEDGSVYRLRFMPTAPGEYIYSVEYRQGWSKKTIKRRLSCERRPSAGARLD
jgi:hypothetical protein